MPIHVVEFLENAGLSAELPKFIQLLTDLTLSSPINSIEVEPEYRQNKYQYEYQEVFSSRIIKGILDHLLSRKVGLIPDLEKQLLLIPNGVNHTNHINHISSLIYLITSAVRFNLIKVGNCVERSAYAAIIFAEIFRDTKIKVSMQGMKTIDHVAVLFGPYQGKHYIYDPLINPDIFIEHQEFLDNIASKIPKIEQRINNFKIVINRGVYTAYTDKKASVMQRIIDRIQNTSVDELWSSEKFKNILTSHGYTKDHLNQAKEILETACSGQTSCPGLNS